MIRFYFPVGWTWVLKVVVCALVPWWLKLTRALQIRGFISGQKHWWTVKGVVYNPWYLNSIARQIHPSLPLPSPPSDSRELHTALLLSCAGARVVTKRWYLMTWDWEQPLFVSYLQSEGCVWTLDFFSAHTQNGHLADREETFAELDKKCIGLEL